MKQIVNFIKEGLKVGAKSKVIKNEIEQDYNNKKKLQVTQDELREIEDYAEDLPVPPDVIKTGAQGNIKLMYDKYHTFFSQKMQYGINISKPERYNGSFKITMDIGRSRPYEYPNGKNYLDKNGNLMLPDIKSIFDQINKVWDKYNMTQQLNKE